MVDKTYYSTVVDQYGNTAADLGWEPGEKIIAPKSKYVTVGQNDSYESIAKEMYGDSRMFAQIMQANGGNPLQPGMQLYMPLQTGTPFVSNELAASMGMATSGQFATAYKSGDMTYGKMNWSLEQAMTNEQWASDWQKGLASPLKYGNLPTGYSPGGTVPAAINTGGRALPSVGSGLSTRKSSSAFLNKNVSQITKPLVGSGWGGNQTMPTLVPALVPRKSSNQFLLKNAARIKPEPNSIGPAEPNSIGPAQPRIVPSPTSAPPGAGGGITPPAKTNMEFWANIFGQVGTPTTASGRPMVSGTPTAQSPNAGTSATTPQTSSGAAEDLSGGYTPLIEEKISSGNMTPAELAVTYSGIDWWAVRKALTIQDPHQYQRWGYSFSGGGGGSVAPITETNAQSALGYLGFINTNVSSGGVK
jgi:hypothetical protein